jgi:dienelactone hydrolase
MAPHDRMPDLDQLSRVFIQQPDELTPQLAPRDRRVSEVGRLDQPNLLRTFRSLEEWQAHAGALRRHILLSTGLWPLPERTALNATIFGRVEREDYSVEKVYFESYPGFFVTGNLYRPRGRAGPFPGVLNPHGHWEEGRLTHHGLVSLPARGISLARQGYVAFLYDMVGYLDSRQVPHTFGGPVAELWGISVMGLQLWNSLRAVDFLVALPDVDPQRLACTGESGGGTQTLMLAAIEDRITVSAPVNMVSAHFQGGCVCENAPNLRLATNNVEIAALMAPRPMLLVACTGDWTRNTPAVEYPAITEIYRLFQAEDQVSCALVDAEHNYNLASREAVYAFFGRWLPRTPLAIDTREQPFRVEEDNVLRVFPGTGPLPGGISAGDLVRQQITRAGDALARHWPRQADDLAAFREIFGPALAHVLPIAWPDTVWSESLGSVEQDHYGLERLLLGRTGLGDQIPALLFRPLDWTGGSAVLAVHAAGKATLIDAPGRRPGALIRELLARDHAVLAVDVFLTGEYHTHAGRAGRDQGVPFFTTYNRTDTAWRVHDVVTALGFLAERVSRSRVAVVGIGEAGLWCLLARALAPMVVRAAIDAAGFSIGDDDGYVERLYVPGLRAVGGLPTALALAAPAPTFIHNTGGGFPLPEIARLYDSLGCPEALAEQDSEAATGAIVEWLSPAPG